MKITNANLAHSFCIDMINDHAAYAADEIGITLDKCLDKLVYSDLHVADREELYKAIQMLEFALPEAERVQNLSRTSKE